MALAALVREIHAQYVGRDLPHLVADRWKLSNDELSGLEKLLSEESIIRAARSNPWPKLQRLLIAPRVDELLGYVEAVSLVVDGSTAEVSFCREKLALPVTELNPPPLITGDDLKRLGIRPGPEYRKLLDLARDAQLEDKIQSRSDVLKRIDEWRKSLTDDP